MKRPVVRCRERGFLQSFSERRVGVTHPGDVLGGGPVFHGHDRFGDHVGGTRSADVNAQDFIGFGVGEDLDEPVGVHRGTGAAAGLERE